MIKIKCSAIEWKLRLCQFASVSPRSIVSVCMNQNPNFLFSERRQAYKFAAFLNLIHSAKNSLIHKRDQQCDTKIYFSSILVIFSLLVNSFAQIFQRELFFFMRICMNVCSFLVFFLLRVLLLFPSFFLHVSLSLTLIYIV